MGYYADLIKEKRNAKYSYNLVKKGEDKWVIQTKYGGKTVDEQEFYGTEEAAKRKGENNVRYFESRNEKEGKENDAAQTAYDYALKLAQQTGDPNFFKVLHRSREHFLANPGLIREWIDEMKGYMKKAGIKNSEEEKDNASEEYIRKMYAEIQELKRKGVKDIDKYYAAINQYKEAEEQMKRYKETGKSYYKTAADNLKREADQWMREIKASIHNEKEEKDNASVQDRFRHKGCMITILKKGENQYTFTVEQNGREEGTNATYPTQDKAESEAKREVEANWNEKEEGYYAKLAEEKAAKKNAKDSSISVYDKVFRYDSEDRTDRERVYNEIQDYGVQIVDRLTDEWHRESQKFQQKIDKARKEIQQALRTVR